MYPRRFLRHSSFSLVSNFNKRFKPPFSRLLSTTPSDQPEPPKSNRFRNGIIIGGACLAAGYYAYGDSLKKASTKTNKPKVVVLGSGWGAVSLLKKIDPNEYDITIISPSNHFLFTPLLPAAIVGTVECRSIIESIRKICKPKDAEFLEGRAEHVNIKEKTVEVKTEHGEVFDVPYDKLVISVGSEVNTFGIKGVKEYCHFLKTTPDVVSIRNRLVENFERAELPSTTKEERDRLLSFVVVGGGPTGVEVAAEICDFLQEDLPKYYPKIEASDVKITLVEGLDRLLNTYDERISHYTETLFKRQKINVIKRAMVSEVKEKEIVYKDTKTNELITIPCGLCVWSTGVGLNAFTKKFKDQIPEQKNFRALVTDSRLRVKGVNDSSIYAIGDCATIDVPKIKSSAVELFKNADKDKNGYLSFVEFAQLIDDVESNHPQIALHFRYMGDIFSEYDKDKDRNLTLEDFETLLEDVEKKIKTLPATAQVASQEGRYLARKLNEIAQGDYKETDDELAPFKYRHLGSLVYIGEEQAAIDFGNDVTTFGKHGTYWLWKSIYLNEQVSLRTRALVIWDWAKKAVFGRDISRIN